MKDNIEYELGEVNKNLERTQGSLNNIEDLLEKLLVVFTVNDPIERTLALREIDERATK